MYQCIVNALIKYGRYRSFVENKILKIGSSSKWEYDFQLDYVEGKDDTQEKSGKFR